MTLKQFPHINFRPEDVTFDQESHSYWLGLIRIPSVSEILRPLTAEGLAKIPSNFLNAKRDIGIAVHKACEDYDLGTLDESALSANVATYFEGYKRFVADHQPEWSSVEQIVVDARGRYAGTLDRAGLIDGRPVVLDIKTSREMQPTTALQLWAYAQAARLADVDLLGLQLLPNQTYQIHRYEDCLTYEGTLLALLCVWRWAQVHRKGVPA